MKILHIRAPIVIGAALILMIGGGAAATGTNGGQAVTTALKIITSAPRSNGNAWMIGSETTNPISDGIEIWASCTTAN